MKKNYIQLFFINSYRSAAFVALSGILLTAVWYLFTLLFYAGSTSWAAPVVLSPSQDRVLALQPQIASMDNLLSKQKVDLLALEDKIKVQEAQKSRLEQLLGKANNAVKAESAVFDKNARELGKIIADKQKDSLAMKSALEEANMLVKETDAELKAALITKEQAIQRKISIQNALNASTDSRAQILQLQSQSSDANNIASTLRGGASSLSAMSTLQQVEQLNSLLAQITIDIESNKQNALSLHRQIKESQRVFDVAEKSPYFQAMTEKVTVLFMPYDNLKNAVPAAPVYDCYLGVVACRKVGEIQNVYEAEEYARHPLYKTDLRGKFVKVKFENPASEQSQVVFIGSKPILF